MLRREDFIGTILHDKFIITDFAGEGAEGVVFVVAPIDNPTKTDQVIKLFKPINFLEMNVLHHSLKIHKELYPGHHLIMSPEKRLELLKQEMLERIATNSIVLRISELKELYHQTIEVLVQQYYKKYRYEGLDDNFLRENPAISIFIDTPFLQTLKDFQSEGLIVDDYIEFVDFIIEHIEDLLEEKNDHSLNKTISGSALTKLYGLFLEDFINLEEIKFISRSDDFNKLMNNDDFEVLFNLLTVFFHKYQSMLINFYNNQENEPKDEKKADELKRLGNKLKSLINGFEILIERAEDKKFCNDLYAGLGYLWIAYILDFFSNDQNDKISMDYLNQSILLFEKLNSIENLHDAYLHMAKLYQQKDNYVSNKYLNLADSIKKTLQKK